MHKAGHIPGLSLTAILGVNAIPAVCDMSPGIPDAPRMAFLHLKVCCGEKVGLMWQLLESFRGRRVTARGFGQPDVQQSVYPEVSWAQRFPALMLAVRLVEFTS